MDTEIIAIIGVSISAAIAASVKAIHASRKSVRPPAIVETEADGSGAHTSPMAKFAALEQRVALLEHKASSGEQSRARLHKEIESLEGKISDLSKEMGKLTTQLALANQALGFKQTRS